MDRTQLIVDILACQLGEYYTPASLAIESTETLVRIRANVRARLAQDILDWREEEARRERMTPAWLDDMEERMSKDPGWRPRCLTRARAALKLARG